MRPLRLWGLVYFPQVPTAREQHSGDSIPRINVFSWDLYINLFWDVVYFFPPLLSSSLMPVAISVIYALREVCGQGKKRLQAFLASLGLSPWWKKSCWAAKRVSSVTLIDGKNEPIFVTQCSGHIPPPWRHPRSLCGLLRSLWPAGLPRLKPPPWDCVAPGMSALLRAYTPPLCSDQSLSCVFQEGNSARSLLLFWCFC